MGPERWMSTGFWIIPMTICILFMLIMFFTRMRGGFGPGMFMNSQSQSNTGKTTESPLDIINKRYAKGEISKSEYEQLKNDLLK